MGVGTLLAPFASIAGFVLTVSLTLAARERLSYPGRSQWAVTGSIRPLTGG